MPAPTLPSMLRHLLLRLYRLPDRRDLVTPHDLGMAADDVTLTAVDGTTLRGWYLPPQPTDGPGPPDRANPSPAVVLVHGWASAAGDLLPAAKAIVDAGLPVLAVDARGHGRSGPVEFMSMPRFAEDAEVAVAWLRAHPGIDPDAVAVVGHSVGAGACLLAASRDPRIAAVVSIASMAHPRDLIHRSFRRRRAPRTLIRASLRTIERTIGHRFDDFAPEHTIARITAPTLIVHGGRDDAVPVADAHRLAVAGGAATTLRVVPDADHHRMGAFEPVVPEIIEHLRAALSLAATSTDPD